MSYKQCTLLWEASYCDRGATCPARELVEWVPSDIAICGKIVYCIGTTWRIIHVGQEQGDPRPAHNSAKAFPSLLPHR